jgi:hypothetical protein
MVGGLIETAGRLVERLGLELQVLALRWQLWTHGWYR